MENKFAHIARWRMPAVLILTPEDKAAINWHDYYFIQWDWPNQNIGSFRACPLNQTPCRNKSDVMLALRSAYNGPINVEQIKLRSFADALEFCSHMGLKVGHYKQHKKTSSYTWLTKGWKP